METKKLTSENVKKFEQCVDGTSLVDLLTVLDNFRPVSKVEVNFKDKKENTEKFHEAMNDFAPGFKVKHYETWLDGFYLVFNSDKEAQVSDFMKKYPNPMDSREAEYYFGLLIGYPKCCVTNHILQRGGINHPDTPFCAHSEECMKPLVDKYTNIIDRFGLKHKTYWFERDLEKLESQKDKISEKDYLDLKNILVSIKEAEEKRKKEWNIDLLSDDLTSNKRKIMNSVCKYVEQLNKSLESVYDRLEDGSEIKKFTGDLINVADISRREAKHSRAALRPGAIWLYRARHKNDYEFTQKLKKGLVD